MFHDARLMSGCLAAALAAALPASALTAGTPRNGNAAPASEGEQRLATLLQGRAAGEAVRCIRDFRNLPLRTISRTAYVYGAGDTVWVQRTQDPRQIGFADMLVIDSTREAASLCNADKARRIDRDTGLSGGIVRFEDFVPYTRVKPAASGEG